MTDAPKRDHFENSKSPLRKAWETAVVEPLHDLANALGPVGKALGTAGSIVFNTVKWGVYWPLKQAANLAWGVEKYGIVKPSKWIWDKAGSIENNGVRKSIRGTTALTAGALTAAYVATLGYGGLYGMVAAGDNIYAYGNETHTGWVTNLSNRGIWPCNTVQGQIGTMGQQKGSKNQDRPTEFAFAYSARRFNPEVIKKLEEAQAKGLHVEIFHKESMWSKVFNPHVFEGAPLACIQTTPFEVTDVRITSEQQQMNASEDPVTHTGERGSSFENHREPSRAPTPHQPQHQHPSHIK